MRSEYPIHDIESMKVALQVYIEHPDEAWGLEGTCNLLQVKRWSDRFMCRGYNGLKNGPSCPLSLMNERTSPDFTSAERSAAAIRFLAEIELREMENWE